MFFLFSAALLIAPLTRAATVKQSRSVAEPQSKSNHRAVTKASSESASKTMVAEAGAVLPAVAPPVTALACTPNSQIMAVGTYRQVQLWNVAVGRRIGVLSGMPENVNCLAFSPDGRILAAGGGVATVRGETRLFDLASGRQIALLTGHTDLVYALAFTPDGNRLVTASGDKTLRLWNWRSGVSLHVLKDHADSVYGVACSPDGRQIASTGVDRSIKIWDAANGKASVHVYGTRAQRYGVFPRFQPGRQIAAVGGRRPPCQIVDSGQITPRIRGNFDA